MRPQSTISTIVLDLDNTLIDRDGAMRAFFRAWLSRHFPGENHDSHLAFISTMDRSGEGDRVEFCSQVLHRCGLQRSGAEALWNEIQHELPLLIESNPRIESLLSSLSHSYTLAIATNGGSALQRAKIRHAGLDRWFSESHRFISGEIGIAKPAAAFFETILERLHAAPSEILFVGDHPENDIRGAAAVGMQTCWISLGRPIPASFVGSYAIDQVCELESLLVSQPLIAAR